MKSGNARSGKTGGSSGPAPASRDILEALRARHPSSEWLFVDEVALPGALSERRLDAMAMAYWPSRAHVRHVFEIKVSRADLKLELGNPEKRLFGLGAAEHFWFAVPEGLMRADELPPECGLMEFIGGAMKIVRAAPSRNVAPASPELMLAMSRRAFSAGRREASARAGIPGWHIMAELLEASIGRRRDFSNGRRIGLAEVLAQKLRGSGFADEGRCVEQMLRSGRRYDAIFDKCLIEAASERMKLSLPVPEACPECGGVPKRDEEALADFFCPSCGWKDSAVLGRKKNGMGSRK